MVGAKEHSSSLVDWAKDGSFDVEKAEQLASSYIAPWESAESSASLSPAHAQDAATAPVAAASSQERAAQPAANQPMVAASVPTVQGLDLLGEASLPRGRSRLWLATAVAAAAVLAAVVWAMSSGSQDDEADARAEATAAGDGSATSARAKDEPTAEPEAEAAQTAAPSEPAAKPDEALPPPAPKVVAAEIRVVPEDAELRIDGKTVANPYKAEVERGSTHKVSAEAKGYRSRELDLYFDEARSVTVRLEKLPTPRRSTAEQQSSDSDSRRTRRKSRTRSRERKTSPGAGFITDNPY